MKYALTILILLLTACNLFETRNPEEPDTGNNNLVPATSPSLLVDNFQTAVGGNNADDYLSCFSDDKDMMFEFTPSSDAFAAYPALFDSWDYSSESRYITSLLANLQSNSKVNISLTNSSLDYVSPDSTIYIADYSLSVAEIAVQTSNTYKGKLQLTLAPNNSGIWKIIRWIDSPPKDKDSTAGTWSLLKAKHFN